MLFQDTIKQNKGFSLGNFTSPFLDEVKDPKELQLRYSRFNVVPFFGVNTESSDTTLNMLYRLADITPIIQGSLDVIKEFATGAGLSLLKAKGKGILNVDYEEANEGINETFEDNYINTFVDTNIIELLELGTQSVTIDGNLGYKVSVEKLSGKTKIEYIPTTEFKYFDEVLNGVKNILISPFWTHTYYQSIEPETIPVFPAFIEEDGIYKTFVHGKSINANRKVYGLSNLASSIIQQYSLNQLFVYASAAIENKFTGQIFFDTELDTSDLDGDTQKSINEFQQNQKNTFTNKGSNKSTIINRFRSPNTAPTTVTQFQANSDHQFYKEFTTILNESIVQSLPVDRRLLLDTSNLFGDNIEAVNKFQSQKVKPTQKILEDSLNDCFDFIESVTGKDIREGYRLVLNSAYVETIEEEEEVKENPNVSRETSNEENK